jgi:hypothetical protein
MALLTLLMRRHPCRCQAGIVALITMALLSLIHESVVVFVTMTLLLSSSWCCCPCHNGVICIIDAQASLPSLQWHCCPCHDGVVAIDAQGLLPFLQMAIIALVAMASVPQLS